MTRRLTDLEGRLAAALRRADKPRYFFKDFVTGKLRFTRGEFLRWTKDGPLNARGALFAGRTSTLFVPEYLLTKETRAALDKLHRGPQYCTECRSGTACDCPALTDNGQEL